MSLTIRPFTPDDYDTLSAIASEVEPEYPETAEEWRHWDEHQEAKCRWERFVAEEGGEPAGFASYSQSASMYHPRKFWVDVRVRPPLQGRGIGRALYEHALRALQPFDPILVRAGTREDRDRAVRFLLDRGFDEAQREWESRLDVPAFDFAPFAAAEERARDHGIEIRTFNELEADPDRNRKLHALRNELEMDVPAPDTQTPVDFEPWERETLNHPTLLRDAWIIAVHEGEYAGYTQLYESKAGNYLDTGLTGVRRAYRRQGIALALKLRAIRFAKDFGTPEIRTWNEVRNVGMLSINNRLGFVRQPAWVEYVKVL